MYLKAFKYIFEPKGLEMSVAFSEPRDQTFRPSRTHVRYILRSINEKDPLRQAQKFADCRINKDPRETTKKLFGF